MGSTEVGRDKGTYRAVGGQLKTPTKLFLRFPCTKSSGNWYNDCSICVLIESKSWQIAISRSLIPAQGKGVQQSINQLCLTLCVFFSKTPKKLNVVGSVSCLLHNIALSIRVEVGSLRCWRMKRAEHSGPVCTLLGGEF